MDTGQGPALFNELSLPPAAAVCPAGWQVPVWGPPRPPLCASLAVSLFLSVSLFLAPPTLPSERPKKAFPEEKAVWLTGLAPNSLASTLACEALSAPPPTLGSHTPERARAFL